jgi:hypothetical protein
MNTQDTFRPVNRGDVTLDVNSRRQTSDRFVDRSRLRSSYVEEYVPSATPGKPGKFTGRTVTASIEDNARQGCDAMKHRSSFVDESLPANDGPSGDCCAVPSYYGGNGPLTRKRGDE